ncbi:MAG: SDR family oxidoreductase [Parahaliea sp.]
MSSTSRLNGKVAIVTGGAKNLGGLISRDLASLGANVVIHFNSDAARTEAEKNAAIIAAMGRETLLVQSDLTLPSNMAALFDQTTEKFGSIDIAINTVGKVLRKPITDTSEAEFDSMMDINAKSAFFFIKEAGQRLNDNGSIVTILTSLLAAFTGGYATYAGAKAPVEHFTRAAAKEFGERGISVSAVAPGPMDTPFFYAEETPERVEYLKSQAMHNRLTNIEDIAPLVKFLVTEGGWVTGQTIFANGGFTTR